MQTSLEKGHIEIVDRNGINTAFFYFLSFRFFQKHLTNTTVTTIKIWRMKSVDMKKLRTTQYGSGQLD